MRPPSALSAVILALTILTAITSAEHPGKVIDLSCWKLTLPIDEDDDGHADEISQPQLDTFQDPKLFFVSANPDAVVFRCHCGGATTKGSQYPRCELREMSSRGKDTPVAWSTSDGRVHTMTAVIAVTQTPPVKQHVVCAQIHDADDDVLMVRLEKKKLFIERNKDSDVVVATDYKLGIKFELKIEAADGHIRLWYDGQLKLNWKVAAKGCYFKAGCYTQSNPAKGDAKDAYGEVTISRLKVEHEIR